MADLAMGPDCSGVHVVADTGYAPGDTVSRAAARETLHSIGEAVQYL